MMQKQSQNNELFSHGHLTSKNIFVDLIEMKVKIADFGCPTLKKFCKLFHQYEMLTNWSAPEVWETQYNSSVVSQSQSTDIERNSSIRKNQKFDGKASYFNSPQIDIYSLGVILWEIETGQQPFVSESKQQMFHLLTVEQLRPRIPTDTNKSLALLIRRCW